MIQYLIFKLISGSYSSNLAVNKPEKQFLQCRQLIQKIREWKGSCSAVCLEFGKGTTSEKLKMMPRLQNKAQKADLARSLGQFQQTIGFNIILENPEALHTFVKVERVRANPSRVIPSCRKEWAESLFRTSDIEL